MKTTFNKTGVNKMKSFTSALLIMATVAAMFSFPMTASAADLGKEPKTKEQLAARTASEIRQDIMDTYGFDYVEIYDTKTDANASKDAVATVETLLSRVGRSVMRKASAHAKALPEENEFKFEISINATMTYGFGSEKGVFSISQSATPNSYVIMHELGHVLDMGVLGSKPLAANGVNTVYGSENLKSINGSYGKYTNASQYLSEYAATSSHEDFAEMFSKMINSGGSAPYTGTRDTILHKKYVAIYKLLLDEFGTSAMCVQRSAAFLGIELPTK